MNVHHLHGWWQHLYLILFIASIAAMGLGNGYVAVGLFAAGLILGLTIDTRHHHPQVSQLRRRQLDNLDDRDNR